MRQLAQIVGGDYGTLEFIGTPGTLADDMQQRPEERDSDGFKVMFVPVPASHPH